MRIHLLALLICSIFFSSGAFSQPCDDVTPNFTVSGTSFCGNGPHTINFTNTSTGIDANTTDYEWLLNGVSFDNTSDLSAPLSQDLSTPGTYTFTLISDQSPPACAQAIDIEVIVFPQPSADFNFGPDGGCAGLPVNFTNTSTGTVAGTTYNWNFGDGTNSTNENPSHTYAFGGTYNVTLTVTNTAGCISTFSQTVTNQDIPNVFVFGDDGDGNTINCLLPGDPTTSQTVDFFNSTTGGVSYFWDFDDGTTSTDFEPSHTFNSYGTYQVTMTATGPNGCTASQTIEVVFERFVSSSMTLDITEYSGCLPHTLSSLQNLSVNATQFVWDFGDGSPPVVTNSMTPPHHSYTEPGNYTISLTASNSCNTANATISPIQIVGAPVAGFNPSVPFGCAPQAVSFANTSTGASPANNYTWNMGNGNTYNNVTTPPAQNYTNQGTYPITITATNACGTDSYTYNMVVDTIPIALILADPIEGCSPLTVDVDNLSTGNILNYFWYLNGVFYSTAQNIGPFTYTYPAGNSPVIQNISLTVSNQCGSSSDAETITIHRPTLAQFTPSLTTVCLGTPVSFTNESLGENLTFEWDFGNGTTSTDQVPGAVTYDTPGTYTVELVADGYCGRDSMEVEITVNPITVAAIAPLAPIEDCSPLTVEFENNSTGVGLTYNWTIDGVFAGNTVTIPPVTFTEAPGNTPVLHTVELTVSSACGTLSVQETITVHRPTLANFTSSSIEVCLGEDFTFTDASLGEDLAWNWNFGDGSVSTLEGPHTITYATPGNYTVELVVEGYCGNDTMEIDVLVNPLTVADFTIPEPIEGCSPLTVTPANNSSGTGITYEWYLDGILFSTDETPTPITFTETAGNAPVIHDLELVVTTVCGVETINQLITVHRPNLADFTALPIEVCLGDEITVTDNSLGEDLEWNWDFGDGSVSTIEGPHVLNYAIDGTYIIQLIVEGYCENDTLEQTVTVHPYPIAAISPDVPDGCQVLEMTFTNTSTIGANYAWNFGANATPTNSNLFDPGTISFPTEGTEMITLDVEQNGCVSSDTVYVDIYPLPVVDFITNPSTGCNPLDVGFVNNSPDNGTESFFWDFGNGNTSTDYSPANELYIALANDSIYDVKLIVTSGLGCADSLIQQVIVNPLPIADFDFVDDVICLNETMQFVNNSIGASTYSWDFGDGNTSAAFAPVHSYITAGTYSVTLTVETAFGCTDVTSHDIVVNPIPEALFSNTTECLGYTTAFTDESNGAPVSWNWDFGDGNNAITQNSTHLYASSGIFNVTLTVENGFACIESITQAVLVNTVPVAGYVATDFCLGNLTSFTNQTVGATVAFEWDFGDGSPFSNATNPTHTFAAIGDYDVRLVAFGGSGCSDTIIQTITITEVPVTDFTFTNVCMNDTTFFTDLTTGNPNSYLWDFGNGNTSTDQNPFEIYSLDGNYTVTLTTAFTASGCFHTISQTIESFPRTTPQFNTNIACFELETNFTDLTVGNPVQWEWNFGDNGAVSSDQNPVYIFSSDGFYDVELVTENSFGCRDTLIQQVQVYPLPTANFDFDTVCLNTATQLTDLSTDAVNWEYNWGDATNVIGIDSPSHTYLVDGTYAVEQIVTNNVGCTDTIIQNIIVRPNPVSNWEADTSCYSYFSSFTDLSTDAVTWSWDFNDIGSLSADQNPQYIFSADGIYPVSLTVENIFGCTDELTQNVLVLPQPIATFDNTTVCAGSEVMFTNTSSGSPIDFSWNFGDGSAETTLENPIHTYTTGGNYDITFIVGNSAGCADTLIQNIEVFTIPQIAFEATTVCLFNVTSFTNQTVDPTPISQWYWEFGDGNSSFQENPTYIYQNPGIYDVVLQVTNINGCDSSVTAQVVVSEIPDADFSADVVCFGSPTTFTDLSTGNPTQWIWNFGDGTVVDGAAVEQHTYQNPGSYVVTLLVIGGQGVCNDQTFQIVSVDVEATAGMIIPTEICENMTFNFVDNSVTNMGTIDTYLWDMGDGTQYNTANGTHQYTTGGSYTVTLTVTTTDGCSNTTTGTILVQGNPTANFVSSLACEGQTTEFTDQSVGNIVNWNWNFGDGGTSTNQNPTHNFANEGMYNATLTVTTADGCSGSQTNAVQVFATPNANFNNNTVCWGDATSFNNTSSITTGNIVSWGWSFGDTEGISNVENPQYTFVDYDDIFDVQLVVTSNEGCTDTVIQTVSLHPIVNFNFAPDRTAGCQPLEVLFTDQSTTSGAANIVGWNWDFGDGYYSFNQNPIHIYADEGSYNVTLTVVTSTDCQFVMELPYSINVYPKPTAGFSVSPTITSIAFPHIQVSDESIGSIDWEYAFGDGYYSNSSNPTHSYDEVGVYTIMQIVRTGFGCIDTAYQVIEITEYFTFFAPNSFTPNNDGMNDQFQWAVQGVDIFEIRIFNRWGEVVYITQDETAFWDGTYMGTVVQDGVYIWQVELMDVNGEWRKLRGHVSVLR